MIAERSVAGNNGAYIKIGLIVLITTIPFVLIVTGLIYLVLSRRVGLGVCSGPEERLPSDYDGALCFRP